MIEPQVDGARRATAPPPVPPLGKRLREALSLCLWLGWVVVSSIPRFVRNAARRRAPRTSIAGAAAAWPVTEAPPDDLDRRSHRLTHVVALALLMAAVAPELSGAALRVAARPATSSVASRLWPALDQPSTVVAADGSRLALLHDGVYRQVVPLDHIPEVVRQAVIAAEDNRFWSHGGYDPQAVGRAALANLQARRVAQGASTITQQLAKQNFVGDSPTVVRKAKELLHAVGLEQRFGKEELLERYLNQVYFGSSAYGVAAAADEYFGAGVGELSASQAALLAGLIRAPTALDPRANPEAATARRDDVLRAMGSAGYLPAPAVAAAVAEPLKVMPARPQEVREPFVVEAVKREFLANPAFGATEEERRRLLLTGGLRIETTIQPRLQTAARAATRWVPESLGSALIAVDPRSGQVVALHDGGAAAAGQFDVATQGSRQPGSTFKPLVAAAALEAGMPESQQLVGDGPVQLDYGGAPEPWRVDNFDGDDYGPIDLRGAVVDSVNTAFAQLAIALGLDRITHMATRLGVDVNRAFGPPESRGPSIALGGLTRGVSPLELASAYATFAAGGTHVSPYFIARVLGPDGQEIHRTRPAPQPAVDGAVNAAMVDILEEAVAEGTGAAAAVPGWDVIGKTGTSDGPADAWFVGAVPVLSATVWVGRPDSDKPVAGLTGGTVSAPIWRSFMAEALRGTRPVDFPAVSAKRPAVSPIKLPEARPCDPETCRKVTS
jgi:membrane peptidoglycan carboxypeptidase